MTQEALKLALEALQDNVIGKSGRMPKTHEAINAIREALAQPEKEPVGVVGTDLGGTHLMYGSKYVGTTPDKKTAIFFKDVPIGAPLYTTPQRTWVGLTDEEVDECYYWKDCQWTTDELVRHVEAKLKEKNT